MVRLFAASVGSAIGFTDMPLLQPTEGYNTREELAGRLGLSSEKNGIPLLHQLISKNSNSRSNSPQVGGIRITTALPAKVLFQRSTRTSRAAGPAPGGAGGRGGGGGAI
jgi:hypothetical protein